MRFLIVIAPLFLLFIVSCVVKKQPANQEKKIIQDTNNSVNKSSEVNRNHVDLENLRAKYPCFKDSTIVSKTNEYFDIDLLGYGNQLNTFQRLIEGAYINYLCIEFMEYFTLFVQKDNVNTANNPKFYFLYALELVKQNKLAEAIDYLDNFLSIQELYSTDSDKYFKYNCDQYDIDWLEYPQKEIAYKYAQYVYDFIKDIGDKGELFSLPVDSMYQDLQRLDAQPLINDLPENIIIILAELLEAKETDYKNLLQDKSKILISSINAFDDQKDIYYLSSQAELLVYAKYFKAKSLLAEFDWNNSFFDKIYPRHLKSFFYFYELERRLFNQNDTELLEHIEKAVKYSSAVGLSFDYPYQINGLISFYKDIVQDEPYLPLSKLYKSLTTSISTGQFNDVLNAVISINNYYNENNLNSLDSAVIVIFQTELINADILHIIPIIPDSLNSSISAFPQYITEDIQPFIDIMLIGGDDMNFLLQNEYAPQNELYYSKNTSKNIGYGFYNLGTINDLREMADYFDPSEKSFNYGMEPFFSMFQQYVSIVDVKGEGYFDGS